ncbi:MAG TPA: type II secretion system protein [Chthoniobacterales bacterium]|jgi:prepilin-type N-terminal cleavage/methylation domain-containing protein|nr:type II secretion system protein [Chthoniobacterales bacterium]
MKKTDSAFTLIELLVVITIIAILASIALPVFNGVTERANQTKDLSNAKQVALALKVFATDNNGFFPSKSPSGDYNSATPLAAGAVSNDAFWWLFPNYLQSEDVFAVASSQWSPASPDNKTDPATATTRVDTLKAGENTYSYVLGLTDTSNAAFPLLADGFSQATPIAYETSKSLKGGVWAGKKAIVIFCDASGQIVKVDSNTPHVVKRPTGENLFASAADWLDATANPVINPQ